MEQFEYLNSFVVQSFPSPVKGITTFNENKCLFILLDNGSCQVYNLNTMKILCVNQFDIMKQGIQCQVVQLNSSKSNQSKELIVTQHKNGIVCVLLVEDNKIIFLSKVETSQIGFQLFRFNEEIFELKNNQIENELQTNKDSNHKRNKEIQFENCGIRILQDECILFTLDKSQQLLTTTSLVTGRKKRITKFYDKKESDIISNFRVLQINSPSGSIHLAILAYEGVAISIMELSKDIFQQIQENDNSDIEGEQNKTHLLHHFYFLCKLSEGEDEDEFKEEEIPKWILQKTNIEPSKEEMPYIFDFTVAVSQNVGNDILLTIFLASNISDIKVIKFSLNQKAILQTTSISLKYLNETVGISKILMSDRHLYLSTLDKQIKIIGLKKSTELSSFSLHNGPINALVLVNQYTNQTTKTKYLISASEDCKVIVIDLDKLRKKSH